MFSRRSVLAALLLVLTGTGAAFAHAKMTASVPADGASVPAGLSQIEMHFSHPMRLTLVRVHATGTDMDVALKGTLPTGYTEAATVPVEPLARDAYDVSWTAVSKDGHVMKGHFSFKVTGPAAPVQ